MSEDLDSSDTILADTNFFVGIGSPTHPKYESVRELAIRRNLVLLVPQRVKTELSAMHIADRVETAVTEGWAELVDPPSPTHADAVAAMDYVRREIARQTGTDEHDVEKADTVFAGLAIEYLQREATQVVVLTDDRVAADAITQAVRQQGYGESVMILTRSEIVDDSDFRVI